MVGVSGLLCALALAAAGTLPGEQLATPDTAAAPLAERLERVTRPIVGRPYLLSPLGEGEGIDPDPRFRLDAFDCTTFVETAVALATTADERAAARRLDQIRYRGEPSFAQRRHLMASQWIPDLVQGGTLTDITRELGGAETKTMRLVMTRERWERRRIAKKLALDPADVPIGTFELPYIPADRLEQWAARVPPGTIINVLRVDVPWSPVVVTHQGLVITKPGSRTRWVRHASPVLKRVIDEPLVSMMRRYQKPRKWPIAGMNLLRVNEAPADGAP